MYIGGPDATLIAYGDLNGQVSSSGSCVDVTADAGTEVDVAAQLSISLPDIYTISYSTPQEPVYGPALFWTGIANAPC